MGSKVGIITSGVAAAYLLEAIKSLGVDVDVLKLGFTHPLPRRLVETFLAKHEKILVVEELDPFLEEGVKALAQERGIDVEIRGKDTGIHRYGELNVGMVERAVAKVLHLESPHLPAAVDTSSLPPRAPILCPGCGHRAAFYALKRVFPPQKTIYATDIGCYTLGALPPLEIGDTCLCMGASIGLGMGLSLADRSKRVVSVIGDSTFYHAGIPGLINAVYNRYNLLVAVLDNETTAMTGHQPNPGSGRNALGEKRARVDPERIARAVGVEVVETVDPYDLPRVMAVLRRLKKVEGTSLLVFRAPCILMELRRKRRLGETIPIYEILEDKCVDCKACYTVIYCPALTPREGEKPRILEDLCMGCGLCHYICPYKAIQPGGERRA
jgi:indolepyruvate ferredoxin oxidoreductase alpha subunit